MVSRLNHGVKVESWWSGK